MSHHTHRATRIVSLVSAAALAMGALTACSLSSGSENEGGASPDGPSGEVLVGVALPSSGPVARTGGLFLKGIELALQHAEESGQLGDLTINLDVQDDANNPNEAVTLVTRFAQAGAVAMFGAHSSPVALAQAQAVEAAELPEFVFGASNAIDNPYQYQINARDSEQIKNVLNFAEANDFETVAFLTDTGAYGTAALDQLSVVVGESDLEIVGSETFEPAASNLTPQLVALQRQDPDFIAMFTFGTPYAAAMQGLAETGWDVPIIGNVAAGDVAVGEIAGEDADGLYYMSPFGGDSEAAEALSEAWEEAYPDDELSFEGAVAYDAMTVLIQAILDGGTTREDVQAWLQQADSVEGLASGTTPWDVASRTPILAEDLTFRLWRSGETEEVDLG